MTWFVTSSYPDDHVETARCARFADVVVLVDRIIESATARSWSFVRLRNGVVRWVVDDGVVVRVRRG